MSYVWRGANADLLPSPLNHLSGKCGTKDWAPRYFHVHTCGRIVEHSREIDLQLSLGRRAQLLTI
jgi:hypothetical protein